MQAQASPSVGRLAAWKRSGLPKMEFTITPRRVSFPKATLLFCGGEGNFKGASSDHFVALQYVCTYRSVRRYLVEIVLNLAPEPESADQEPAHS